MSDICSFTQEDISRLRREMAVLAGGDGDFELTCSVGEGLKAEKDHGKAHVEAEDLNALSRGLFQLLLHREEETFYLEQNRHFRKCGILVDMSRGAVMTVEAVRRLLRVMAGLGMNTMLLYTEDTYTIKEYPYFGYLRGRYSADEMKEMDEAAAGYGIDLVPSIQTLAHMGSFLQWNDSIPLRDQPTILLADDEDVYRLIEAEVRTMRENLRSGSIHIGMDEAASLGLGRYYRIHGPTDRFDLLSRHLKRVVEICGKYGFRPMMWSDMFFTLGSKTGDYYDLDADIPERVTDALPEVDLCYWDYDHMEKDFYLAMLRRHRRMGRPTVFAGAVHTWQGFVPNVQRTEATMYPAMQACLEHGTETVLGTIWGDDGNEADMFLALQCLPIFSEHCWLGEKCTEQHVRKMGQRVSPLPPEAMEAMRAWFPGPVDRRTGKGLIYGDPLYPFLEYPEDSPEAFYKRGTEALRVLENLDGNSLCPETVYLRYVFRVACGKARVMTELRRYYEMGDREKLKQAALEIIPPLLEDYDACMKAHRKLWERDFKRNGWELLSLRYGACRGRLADVQDAVLRYAAGELDSLAELEEKPLPSARKGGMQFFQTYTVPSHYI